MITSVLQCGSDEEFITKTVERMEELVNDAISKNGSAVVGLSGGSTPKPIYEKLSKSAIDWNKVTLFLMDERYVDPSHKDSNQKMIRETLTDHIAIPEGRVLFPLTTLPIDACMADYEKKIETLKPDLFIFGMGEDGHTASIFPPVSEEILGSKKKVVHTQTDTFAVKDRLSLSLDVLSSAKNSLLLLRGDEKKKVLEEMMKSAEGPERWPLKVIIEQSEMEVILL